MPPRAKGTSAGETRDPLLLSLEERVLKICEQKPVGLTDVEIFEQVEEDVKPNTRAAVYNKLLSKGRVRIAQRQSTGPDGKPLVQIIYLYVSASDAAKFRGLDATDRMAYDVVRKTGENGATKRDIKIRTNIQSTAEITEIIDRLIQRKLIKEIKSVQTRKRCVYIISDLDPSPQHTGGPWYNDEQQYDTEFIEAIYAQVLAFMKRHSQVSVKQVTAYIAQIKLSNETLTHDHLRALMSTMMYDGAIERVPLDEAGAEVNYRVVVKIPAANHVANMPCGTCPVFKSCVPGGVISPERCLYMTEWLNKSIEW